jgi:DNA-binding LytR/AlgR family response regulator
MSNRKKEQISVFIAEDEQPARDYLLNLVLKRKELKVEGWAKDGKETLQKLTSANYDLLFLDINLPVISGLEILEKIKNPPYVIFTTAYASHAVKAFDIGAIDYLLKPFSENRFNNAVEKAILILKNRAGSNPVTQGMSL